MGFCFSKQALKDQQGTTTEKVQSNLKLNKVERQYLKLIYTDLANRSPTKLLNQHNFSLFFQLTGLWGDKLFKFFAPNSQSQINQTNFLFGMSIYKFIRGKIVRSSLEERINLLFNFIKSSNDRGIKYKQFLKMLYHYSKPELKEIMTNDGVFVHEAIIPSSKELKKEKQTEVIHLKHDPKSQSNPNQMNQINLFQKAYQKISKEYQDPGTLIQFKTQKLTYQVSYCNMSALTKSYATHIFQKYGINQENGSMNQEQFKDYVGGNKTLYESYYSAFHEQLWGWSNGPLFFNHIQKESNIILTEGINSREGYMMLVSNTLFFSKKAEKREEVFRIIILQGVAVHEQDDKKMMIKDQLEGSSIVTIEFPSESIRNNWLQQLKIYNNNYFQNKYDVKESVGTGKFSVVFRCQQRATKNQYALKVLQLDKLTQKQLAAIQNQTEIAKILNSPHFAKLHETIFTKRTIYIVSEYIYGEDLFQFVRKRKRVKESEAAFLLGQIIQAVIHLHSMDIIHRDLKPQNIMVSYKRIENLSEEHSPLKIARPKPQKIKIIDFGFANYLSTLQQMNEQTVGTPGYIAPELLLGQKPSFQNDIFSIGCIFYYMLRGKYPFISTNSIEIALLAIKGQYSLQDGVWDQISDEAKDLIRKLMESDPNERIPLKQALNHPWFISLNGYNSYT